MEEMSNKTIQILLVGCIGYLFILTYAFINIAATQSKKINNLENIQCMDGSDIDRIKEKLNMDY